MTSPQMGGAPIFGDGDIFTILFTLGDDYFLLFIAMTYSENVAITQK